MACSDNGETEPTATLPLQSVVAFATTDGPLKIIPLRTANAPVTAAQATRFPTALLFSPDGTRAFVVTETQIDMFDAATGERLTTRSYGRTLGDAAISPDGQRLYVLTANARLVSISTAELDLRDSLLLADPPRPNALTVAVTPDGASLYVGINGDQMTLEISTNPLAIVDVIATGANRGVQFSPDGATAYLVGEQVTVLDIATNAVTDTLPRMGVVPVTLGMALSPAGDRAFVFVSDTTGADPGASFDTAWMDVVQLTSTTVTERLPLPELMYRPTISPSGQRLYAVATPGVYVIATSSPTVEALLVDEHIGSGAKPAVNP